YVQNRLHEEEPPFTGDIAVFQITFPQLINGDDFTIATDASRLPAPSPALGKQDPHLLAQAVDPLLVDHQSVLPAQPMRQLVITVGVAVTFNRRSEQVLNTVVTYLFAPTSQHVSRTGSPPKTSRSFERVAPAPIIRGGTYAHDSEDYTHRIAQINPFFCHVQSFSKRWLPFLSRSLKMAISRSFSPRSFLSCSFSRSIS